MMFDKDLQENAAEEELPFFDIKGQSSTIFTNGRMTPMALFTPSPSPFFQNPEMEFETSLDKQLYEHNAGLIHKAIVAFIKHCLNCPIDDTGVFQDGKIFCFEEEAASSQQEEPTESLVIRNHLLTPWKKKQMGEVFSKYSDLIGVFQEIKNLCGQTITRELVYILSEVLTLKLKKLEDLQISETSEILPRMERFWGDQDEEKIVRGGWNVYYEADYDQVKLLAAADIEAFSSSLYFSNRLKHLVLVSVRKELIAEVNLVDKFTTLVTFIIEALLLSMEGISQREQQFAAFVSDLNYTTTVTGEVEAHSSKKIKVEGEE